MSPKVHLKSLKARFKRILSDREGNKSHVLNDSASSSSSDKKKFASPSRFKKKRSSSSSSSVNSKMKKIPSVVRTDVSSSSSSSDDIEGSPSEKKRESNKLSSSSSEFSWNSESRIPAKSIKKLQLIGLESRLKLPLHETSQVSPSSKIFASDSKLLSEKDRDQRGSRRGLWSTTLSPTTSTETSSPALPRHSFSLNDSSAPSSPGRAEKTKVPKELSASQSSYDPTYELLGKSEGNSEVQSKISSPKVKRIQSAFLDEERGVWRCRNCDWIYPNPNPSARHRREHKKHCGEMLNVQQWLKVIDPGEEDVQGPVEEGFEEGPLRGVLELRTEERKAPLSLNQDQEETENKALSDSNRATACEDMTVQEPVDETERVREVDDGESDLLDVESVAEAKATDSRDDTTEITPDGENISEPGAESGEGDSHSLKATQTDSDNAVVVNGFADNDAEGQGTQTDVGTVNSANGDLDDVGVTKVEEQRNVEGTEGHKHDRQGDESYDASGTEGPGHLHLERLHADAHDGMRMGGVKEAVKDEEFPTDVTDDPVDDSTAESSEVVEDGQKEFALGADGSDRKTKEKVDLGTSALVARQDDVDNVRGGVESENESSINEKLSALGTDHEMTSRTSISHVMVGNHDSGSPTVSNGLNGDNGVDSMNQAPCEPHTARSASSSSTSTFSSISSSAGDDSDNDKSTPRKTNQDMKPPVSGFQDSHFTERNGSTAVTDINLSQPVEEATSTPWRSRNAMQDEILESIMDEAASSTSWTRHQVSVPETDEGSHVVITPNITTQITWQSPPETTVTTTSISHEVGIVGSAIKKDIFKNRQTFWAEITRSDILEGNQRSPSSISPFANHTTAADVEAVPGPSNVVTPYHSWQVSPDKKVVVTESESVSNEASTSNFHFEASTSNFHPVSLGSSSNAASVDEYDLERVIHEQKTHDIMCPVCGSCITERVILRKRKRYLPAEDPKRPRLPVPSAPEPVSPSTKSHDGWGCFACFSIFFPKVPRGKEESEDTKEGSSCLQLVFPSFPWGPKERLTDPAETPSTPTPLPPSSEEDGIKPKEDGCSSYLNVFKRPSEPESSRPADPGIHEPEPPSTSTPLPTSSEKENCFSYLRIFSRSSVTGSPRPGKIPEKPEDLKEERSLPGVEPDGGVRTRELPISSSPRASKSEPASPNEIFEVKPPVLPTRIIYPSPPVSPRENDRCQCFDIFLPVFAWASPELNVRNDVPPVIPGPPLDRQCLPLVWFSKKPQEQPEGEERVTQPEVQKSLDENALPGAATKTVPTPETPDSPSPRECLPFIRSHLYRKPSEPHEPERLSIVVQREPWRDYKPGADITTHQLYVRQFFDPFPPISRRKPPGPRKLKADPAPPRVPGQYSERPATNCVDLVLPTFPWGSPVQDPEGPATNCLDLVLPTFRWGRPVEEPSCDPVGSEEQPRPTTPRKPSETATDLKEPVQTEEVTRPLEQPIEGENRYKTSKFLGHVVTEEVIVTNSGIEVIKNTTHIESLLDSENHIVTLEEIRENPRSGPTPSTSGPSKESGDIARRVTEGVTLMKQEPPRGQGTDESPAHQRISRSCLPFDFPRLSFSWEEHPGGKGTRTSKLEVVPHLPVSPIPVRRRQQDPYGGESLKQPLLGEDEIVPDQISPPTVNVDFDLVVKIQDSVHVHVPDTPGENHEILKSFVYGGLDTTLISLGVVSSATGGDAKTLTVICIGLANVVFGFLTFLGTISALYRSDKSKFKQLVGPSYRINGLLAAFAYLLFGVLPPITYGFSFRHETNRDWKMGATCLVVLVSLFLLGWAKARVTARSPYIVISTLVTTGFVAAIASYKVGDYVGWLLKDLGFDSV